MSTEAMIRLIRDGEKGRKVEIIQAYLSLLTLHHQNDSCIS